MNPEPQEQSELEQRVARLQADLNDAHLVIGQQQVALLRLHQILQDKEREMLSAQTDSSLVSE